MNRMKFILGVLFLLFLTGCTPRVVISENWNWRPATIAVIYTNPVVANSDDVEDDLPEYVNSFPVWMSAGLKRNIEAKAENLNDHSRMHVSVVAYPLGISGANNFYMGESGVMINNRDVFAIDDERLALPDADVYLFVDSIQINSMLTGGGLGLLGFLLHEGILTMVGNYGFYDGKTHERLGYGTLSALEEYAFGVSRSNWENLMEIVVKKLFEDTPVLECAYCSVRAEANWKEHRATTPRKNAPKKSVWD
ncbi:hypothetical protein [Fibrobacter succinogenes]|uniref:hypothetical protein n=1 Tax=Fibrobacter succinogenes TaxID=833 RepID=UPI0015694846|nr:hypothetical protein [Fibrobacter succinogenes]